MIHNDHYDAKLIAMARAGYTSDQIAVRVEMSGGGLRKRLSVLRARGEVPDEPRRVIERRGCRLPVCDDDDEPIKTISE